MENQFKKFSSYLSEKEEKCECKCNSCNKKEQDCKNCTCDPCTCKNCKCNKE